MVCTCQLNKEVWSGISVLCMNFDWLILILKFFLIVVIHNLIL